MGLAIEHGIPCFAQWSELGTDFYVNQDPAPTLWFDRLGPPKLPHGCLKASRIGPLTGSPWPRRALAWRNAQIGGPDDERPNKLLSLFLARSRVRPAPRIRLGLTPRTAVTRSWVRRPVAQLPFQ